MMKNDLHDRYVEMVTGKDVIVVGPSASVFDDCRGIDVDSYDLVCRLNYHWRMKPPEGVEDTRGKRFDMIYHCLNNEQYTREDLQLWKERGTMVITPHDMDHHADHLKTKRYKKKNMDAGFEIMCLPNELFEEFKRKFKSNPNTGTLAVIHLLSLPVRTVTVVGFDFYSSLYWFRKDEKFRSIIHNMPHKPRVQFIHFKEYVSNFDNFIPVGKLKEMLEA